jgi:hypothetical protein
MEIPLGEIHESPPGRELTGDQIRRLKRLCKILGPVCNAWVSVSETIETFMRDWHPEAEIRLWENMAKVFEAEMTDRPAEDGPKVMGVILDISFGRMPETDLPNVGRIKKSWEELPHKWIKGAYQEDNC